MSDNPLEPCNGIFSTCMGLPCAHIIQQHLLMNQSLDMDDIHHHWWIKGHQLPQARDVENPLSQLLNELTHKYDSWHVPNNGRLVGLRNKAQNSTKRDSSAFELEEIRINSRRCGMCKRTGHNSRTCPNNVKHSVTEI
ncbi:18807_t:CDS:2 [Gigaspora margarita]|uniref:18807_t:CDS:1 n=1 Tax=Gigaspora margarita TaxID=4874 RepID=A0ABM8W604_GIGMA|nr:18807_t:CDS:2 [Gigaspora margarita]